MTTVARRIFRSSPHRDTSATWGAIVDLLTKGSTGAARTELLSVQGIASSMLAERAPQDAAIVVSCEGPRTRIYCLYDEEAIGGTDAQEDPLGYDPLRGEWAVSLPCPADDLAWVTNALKAVTKRITARDMVSALGEDATSKSNAGVPKISINTEAFFKS